MPMPLNTTARMMNSMVDVAKVAVWVKTRLSKPKVMKNVNKSCTKRIHRLLAPVIKNWAAKMSGKGSKRSGPLAKNHCVNPNNKAPTNPKKSEGAKARSWLSSINLELGQR